MNNEMKPLMIALERLNDEYLKPEIDPLIDCGPLTKENAEAAMDKWSAQRNHRLDLLDSVLVEYRNTVKELSRLNKE